MSKKWYPAIDYLECAECGACIDKCSHGVYDKINKSTPVVINGDSCSCGGNCL